MLNAQVPYVTASPTQGQTPLFASLEDQLGRVESGYRTWRQRAPDA